MKNITLSAQDAVIDDLRLFARKDNTTVNALFREWVHTYIETRRKTEGEQLAKAFEDSYKYFVIKSGRKYTREEMNER